MAAEHIANCLLASPRWVPLLPNDHHINHHDTDCRKICGAWFRDSPQDYHRGIRKFLGVEYSKGLHAFKHGEVTDPNLDMAIRSSTEIQRPLTTVSKIMELPTEIMQQILAHVIPSECTFQFSPAREEGNTSSVPCVQKFVADPIPEGSGSNRNPPDCPCRTKVDPSTGSTYLSIAATCRRLQNEAYAIFYSQNTFIFHLTTCAIRSEVQSEDSSTVRAWSRAVPQSQPNRNAADDSGLGPLTPLAISYLRKVMLIPSTPPAPTTQEIADLTAIMGRVSVSLRHARLKSLTIDFQQPLKSTSTDKRFVLKVLTIDSLDAEINEESGLTLVLRDPGIILVRERNRTQQALEPLLDVGDSFSKVDELILSGYMSESIKAGLEKAFLKAEDSAADDRTQSSGRVMVEGGSSPGKRKRL